MYSTGKYSIDELRDWYNQYFKMFRDNAPKHMVEWGGYQLGLPTGMASSFESIIEFAKIVHNEKCPIINAGAGASSWLLRKMFPHVICTDPDKEYLEVVKNICKLGGLDEIMFIHYLDRCPDCDYCYYDYGNIERMGMLNEAVFRTHYALYVDDTDTRPDCKEYRDYVYTYAGIKNLGIKDCKEAIDEYGRWGVILTKEKFSV